MYKRIDPLRQLQQRGPITAHLEGPHSHEKCHRVKVIVPTNPQTRLQCVQNDATVVPVNDARTQCTTSAKVHVEANGIQEIGAFTQLMAMV